MSAATAALHLGGVRAAADLYLELGFRVVPLYGSSEQGCGCGSPECKPRDWGKHEPPDTDGLWKEGHEFSAEDFAPGKNIALAMGPWGGSDDWLVALDVDGASSPAWWFGTLPETLTQRTPRGSHHVYAVPAFTPLGNWVDVFRGKAAGEQATLDLRYARGRIVAAPSRGYEWLRIQEPAALPPSVIERILDERRARGLPVLSVWERNGKAP